MSCLLDTKVLFRLKSVGQGVVVDRFVVVMIDFSCAKILLARYPSLVEWSMRGRRTTLCCSLSFTTVDESN